MSNQSYIMEHEEESIRLLMKTDKDSVERQAQWAGLEPGMRVADIGCGIGLTTEYLYQAVQPGGSAIGIDMSQDRIDYARQHYEKPGVSFYCRHILEPLDDLGQFDFIWIRFVLEYHRTTSFDIVKNMARILKPDGIMCLIDLDYNCLNHFGLSERLNRALTGIMNRLEKKADFDPYVGIKLYSYLYDLNFNYIDVHMGPHHLIFGKLNKVDAFNWTKKVEVAGRQSGYEFPEYTGGFEEFFTEFQTYFHDPRRFTYTPLISCRGVKP